MRRIVLGMLLAGRLLHSADLKPETSAAYDRYIKLVEDDFASRTARNYLWLDSHPKEKTQVWLSQSMMAPREMLDHGQKIEIPDGALQHWFGAVYLETATFERLRDELVDFANYKNWFGPQVIDSRVKRDENNFDVFLRLNKKQITKVVLNADLKATYATLDPTHGSLTVRSTRIGEALHPGNKKSYDQEQPADEQNGYLWRLNIYWRFETSDVGVYLEMDMISLARASGGLVAPGKYLNGFQTFPRELADRLFEAIAAGFPALHK